MEICHDSALQILHGFGFIRLLGLLILFESEALPDIRRWFHLLLLLFWLSVHTQFHYFLRLRVYIFVSV